MVPHDAKMTRGTCRACLATMHGHAHGTMTCHAMSCHAIRGAWVGWTDRAPHSCPLSTCVTQYASCWWYMATHLGLCNGISARIRNCCGGGVCAVQTG